MVGCRKIWERFHRGKFTPKKLFNFPDSFPDKRYEEIKVQTEDAFDDLEHYIDVEEKQEGEKGCGKEIGTRS